MNCRKVERSIIICIIMMLCGCARGEATPLVNREDMSVVIIQESVTMNESEELESVEKEVSAEVGTPVGRALPTPGKVTIENFLITAILPVGKTMYVWGGGWNEEDTGAGADACTIGVSPAWAEFAAEQEATYDYDDTRYQIHDGLDCSGYMGWLVYNLLETEDGQPGYVTKATDMAADFATRGFGEFTVAEDVTDW